MAGFSVQNETEMLHYSLRKEELKEKAMPTNALKSDDFSDLLSIDSTHVENYQIRPKALARGKVYTFKKKTPIAGAYPNQFSPYRMQSGRSLKMPVSLTHVEINHDMKVIEQEYPQCFASAYFEEEVHSDPQNLTSPSCGTKSASNPDSKMIIYRNSARRRAPPTLQLAPIPSTLQEERRQLRAAMKASVAAKMLEDKQSLG
jgi:hypothetical protein